MVMTVMMMVVVVVVVIVDELPALVCIINWVISLLCVQPKLSFSVSSYSVECL